MSGRSKKDPDYIEDVWDYDNDDPGAHLRDYAENTLAKEVSDMVCAGCEQECAYEEVCPGYDMLVEMENQLDAVAIELTREQMAAWAKRTLGVEATDAG